MSTIRCYDKDGSIIDELYQWDENVKVKISDIDISNVSQLHFCNRKSETALVVTATVSNGSITANIPNVLLRQPESIIIFICEALSGGEIRTTHVCRVAIHPRPKADDSIYVEDSSSGKDPVSGGGSGSSSGSTTVTTEGAVVYNATQVLSEEQKQIARSNIGAVSETEVITLISTHAGSSGSTPDGAVLYTETQALTEEQQQTARDNISALSEDDVRTLIPVTISEDGYTDISGLRQIENIQYVYDGTDVTMTMLFEGDETLVSTMSFDENNMPSQIVTDDFAMTIGWEGFDTETEDETTSGENGATFTPSVSEDGTLSWTNDKGLENPASVNIMGPAYTLTDDDKATIISAVLAELPSWKGGSY